jgi:hypothetical protein
MVLIDEQKISMYVWINTLIHRTLKCRPNSKVLEISAVWFLFHDW